MGDAWMPIETAPKGRPDIPRDAPFILVTDGGIPVVAFWNGVSWDDGDFHDNLRGLTHWMPLPPPPATPTGER